MLYCFARTRLSDFCNSSCLADFETAKLLLASHSLHLTSLVSFAITYLAQQQYLSIVNNLQVGRPDNNAFNEGLFVQHRSQVQINAIFRVSCCSFRLKKVFSFQLYTFYTFSVDYFRWRLLGCSTMFCLTIIWIQFDNSRIGHFQVIFSYMSLVEIRINPT